MKPDKQQKLNEVTGDILFYLNIIWLYNDVFNKIHESFVDGPPFVNFRDSLFHYRRMYEAGEDDNESAFTQQYACIMEHLNRGFKDFFIHICFNFYTKVIHKMIDSKTISVIIDRDISRLRTIYHNFKNIVIQIRTEGNSLDHFLSHRVNWLPDVTSTIKAFSDLLNENSKLGQLYQNIVDEIFKKNK